VNAGTIDMAGLRQAAGAWVDKELHRWGACLLIVLALHAGAIVSFEAWKTGADQHPPPSGAMMIDLGPLPGPGGQGTSNKLGGQPHHGVANPFVQPEARKHTHFHRLVKLRARIEHRQKPPPEVVEHVAPPSAVALLKPQNTLAAPRSVEAPAKGFGATRAGSGTGDSAGPSGSCCSGASSSGAVGFGKDGTAAWQGLVLTDLEAHKRYPPEARERGEQGVVYLRFAMDRHGKVLSSGVQRSSGFDDLDEETLELIQRSQPLPPPPSTVAGNTLELVVPIQFRLEQDD